MLRDPFFCRSFLSLIISILVSQPSLFITVVILVASTRHAPLTSRVYLRLAKRPSAQFANSTYKNNPQALEIATALLQAKEGYQPNKPLCRKQQDLPSIFFPMISSTWEKNTTNDLLTRTNFQRFLNQASCSSFKKLIISTPLLLQGQHMMSLLKSVPDGLKPQECKRTKLREPPPVPYVPTKDEVQEEVAKLWNLKIKTTIEKDTTLNFPVWHENGTHKAFLMHVMVVLDAIKKRGHFHVYKKAEKAYNEAEKAIESARAGLSLLNGTGARSRRFCKKKAKEAPKKALAKAQDSELKAKEAKEATEVDNDTMKAGFLEDLEKAKQA